MIRNFTRNADKVFSILLRNTKPQKLSRPSPFLFEDTWMLQPHQRSASAQDQRRCYFESDRGEDADSDSNSNSGGSGPLPGYRAPDEGTCYSQGILRTSARLLSFARIPFTECHLLSRSMPIGRKKPEPIRPVGMLNSDKMQYVGRSIELWPKTPHRVRRLQISRNLAPTPITSSIPLGDSNR